MASNALKPDPPDGFASAMVTANIFMLDVLVYVIS